VSNPKKQPKKTKKDFIAMSVLHNMSEMLYSLPPYDYFGKQGSGNVALLRRVDALFDAPCGFDVKGEPQSEIVFNSPFAICRRVVWIKFNKSPSRSFGEWIGMRRHLSFLKSLFSMMCLSTFSTSGRVTFLK